MILLVVSFLILLSRLSTGFNVDFAVGVSSISLVVLLEMVFLCIFFFGDILGSGSNVPMFDLRFFHQQISIQHKKSFTNL